MGCLFVKLLQFLLYVYGETEIIILHFFVFFAILCQISRYYSINQYFYNMSCYSAHFDTKNKFVTELLVILLTFLYFRENQIFRD